jgi:hypothetical protein
VERIAHEEPDSGLWISMGNSLAQPSGRFQPKLWSPLFGFGPQRRQHGKKFRQHM